MSKTTLAGPVIEARAQRIVHASTDEVIELKDLFENLEGLDPKDLPWYKVSRKSIVKFTTAFPRNILIVFAVFFIILITLNLITGALVGLTYMSAGDIAKERAEQYQIIAANEGPNGNKVALAKARYRLTELDNEQRAPSDLKGSIMTVFGLTTAIAGIFSLPLITTASVSLLLFRVSAAKAVQEDRKASRAAAAKQPKQKQQRRAPSKQPRKSASAPAPAATGK